jgi:hypothetical protein
MMRRDSRYHLYLLGTFHIESDAASIRLPTRKVESLFAFLALFPEPHPREKLAALFWGDVTDEQARTSLRTALAAIRKELGDDILIADRETVQINPEFPLWVDAREIFDLRFSIADLEIENLKSKIMPATCSPISTTIGLRPNANVCTRSISICCCNWHNTRARKANMRARLNSRVKS